MRDYHQYSMSRIARYSHYVPTQYTPAHYTPAQYTPTHYTPAPYTPTHYTPTHYTPAHYTPTHCTSAHYTPKRYTSKQYTPTDYAPTHYTPLHCTSASVSLKPARTVHFPNDIVFQDHIRQGDLEQIGRFLRAKKVRLDTIYLSGMAALHEAVLSGNLECVKLLVKYGADVHQRDEDDWTPLHMACSDGFPHIAQYLLSLGASIEAVNKSGEKPVDLIDPDCKELAKLFEVGCV